MLTKRDRNHRTAANSNANITDTQRANTIDLMTEYNDSAEEVKHYSASCLSPEILTHGQEATTKTGAFPFSSQSHPNTAYKETSCQECKIFKNRVFTT